MDRPLHSQRIVHLLGPEVVDSTSRGAYLVAPSGDRIGLSDAVWGAVEHVLACASAGRPSYVMPLDEWVSIAAAGLVTGWPVDYVRRLIAEGELTMVATPLGGAVRVDDLVAVKNEYQARSDAAFREYLDISAEIADGESG